MLIGVAFDLDVDNLIMACMVRSHPGQAISVRLIGRKDVCDFFPPLTGSLNERFHFNHLPLGKKFRNFLEVDIRFDEECTNIQAKIVPVSTDIFKDHVWED